MPRTASLPRTVALATVAALAATTTAGCGGGSGSGRDARTGEDGSAPISTSALPASFTEQKLEWAECAAQDPEAGGTAPPPLPDGTSWQCATLKAPLDYGDPEGETVDLALIRAKTSAPDKDRRIGSLLFNFGGPGGSGMTALPGFSQDYEKLRTRYDLVSFDPRGVGLSRGVACLDDRRLDAYHSADWTPDTAQEERDLLSRQSEYAAACQSNSGSVLPHLTTTNTARDMDLMRHVLGDRRLYYFGISYGTELGGVYAHLFPEKVGRALFDGVVDPTQTPDESTLSQAKGFQLALGNYARACAAQDEQCPLGSDPEKAEEKIAALLRKLDRKPMPTGENNRRLTESLAANGIAQSLYSPDFWEYLSQGLKEARAGNGETLLALGDAMNGRSEDGTYNTLQASLMAIRCADSKQRYGIGDIKARLPKFTTAAPVFGPMSAWSMAACSGWPVDGETDMPVVSADGAAPILVVGNTGDPATPYQGMRKMKDALGKGVGVELTYEGEGHGAYDSGSPCVVRYVNGYLLNGKVPPDGSRCSS